MLNGHQLVGTVTRMTSTQFVADQVYPYGTGSKVCGSYPEAKDWIGRAVSGPLKEETDPNLPPPQIVYLYTPGNVVHPS